LRALRINEIKRSGDNPVRMMGIGAKEIVRQWCDENINGEFRISEDLKITTDNYRMTSRELPELIKFEKVCDFYCDGLGMTKEQLLAALPEKILNKLICWENAKVKIEEIKSVCDVGKYAQVFTEAGKPDVNKLYRRKTDPSGVIDGMKYDIDGNIIEVAYVNHFITYALLKYIQLKGREGANSTDVINLAKKMVYPRSHPSTIGYYEAAFQVRYHGPMVKYTDKIKMKTYVINNRGKDFISEWSSKFEKYLSS
jgi:hypothetical protein